MLPLDGLGAAWGCCPGDSPGDSALGTAQGHCSGHVQVTGAHRAKGASSREDAVLHQYQRPFECFHRKKLKSCLKQIKLSQWLPCIFSSNHAKWTKTKVPRKCSGVPHGELKLGAYVWSPRALSDFRPQE